ncbi:type I restriction endonuclease, partial [Solemya elarraichensis gill symbiont]
MYQDEERKVELPAIEQLQSLGWDYVHGSLLSPDASDERDFFKDVVLTKCLTDAVKRINPWINDINLRTVVRELTHLKVATLMEANQSVWETLVRYQSVIQDLGKGTKGQTVKVIDFESPDNNEYLCTNQFKIEGVNQNIIPDIVLFVNGLPFAVIECKSPYITNPMEAGIDQLMRYANRRQPHEDEGAEKLFHYNQLMISTHRDKARVGTISSRMEHYLEWKDPYPLAVNEVSENANSQEVLIAGLFNKQNFLDLIQNFTVFEPMDGKVIKKIARYQQYRAV